MKEIVIAMTGSSGNMGQATVPQLMEIPEVKKLELLFLNTKKDKKICKTIH